MSNTCPVCDKEFVSIELFDKHVQKHLNEPTINKPIEKDDNIFLNEKIYESMDLKEIFSAEKFEKSVQLKMEQIDNDAEILNKQNFIKKIKKINQKNPFLYLPYYIKDFMEGMSTKNLEHKYHIWFWMDHRNVTHNILQFYENRYTSRKYDNVLELNLKIINWKDKYQQLENNCKFFKQELNELVFDNALQAEIIFLLMDKELNKEEILSEIERIKDHYDLYHFVDDKLVNNFNSILELNVEERIDNILHGLKKEGVIKRVGIGSRKLITTFSMDKIKNKIIHELEYEGKIKYPILRNSITNKFPGLRLIPKFGIFETSWRELEEEGKIVIEYRSSRRNDFEIFLHEDYLKIQEKLDMLESKSEKIQFKGRKITPEIFVTELLELEKGDFNDEDDQVTRIAGLVLAESVSLRSPIEKIKEFDFSMNISDYDFRPDQIEAMKKLNFQIYSTMFHVKVMIDEIITLKKYQNLLEKLPTNEQGVVITFKKIPLNVKKLLENNPTIQIINEEGIKTWVSITSVIPSRINSICKIYSDPLSTLENKLVKINSVFYEKGIALVTVFPEMNEIAVLVRSLEEIPLHESNPSNFNLISKNYSEFIKILSNSTLNDDLVKGFFKNTFTEEPKNSKTTFKLKFEYNTVNLNLELGEKRDIFNCDCMKYAENPLRLCSHLVTALDYVFRSFSYGDESWNDYNLMKNSLESFLRENLEIILDRLDVVEEAGLIVDEHKVMNFISGVIKTKKSS